MSTHGAYLNIFKASVVILLSQIISISCAEAEKDEILLLTFNILGDSVQASKLGSSELSTISTRWGASQPQKSLVRNLVLYLHTSTEGATVIERAAISIGTDNIIGVEVQELEEMRGAPFSRARFLKPNSWLRDLNFDGYLDLVLSDREGLDEKIFLFNKESTQFRIVESNEYASDFTLIFSLGKHGNF